jgi:hypothetical protein
MMQYYVLTDKGKTFRNKASERWRLANVNSDVTIDNPVFLGNISSVLDGPYYFDDDIDKDKDYGHDKDAFSFCLNHGLITLRKANAVEKWAEGKDEHYSGDSGIRSYNNAYGSESFGDESKRKSTARWLVHNPSFYAEPKGHGSVEQIMGHSIDYFASDQYNYNQEYSLEDSTADYAIYKLPLSSLHCPQCGRAGSQEMQTSGFCECGKKFALPRIEKEKFLKNIANADKIRSMFDFLDFYVRRANNNVSEREKVFYAKQLKEQIIKILNTPDFFGTNSRDFTLAGETNVIGREIPEEWTEKKKEELQKIVKLLSSDDSLDNSVGLEKFINVAHDNEPNLIPHAFGLDYCEMRQDLQSVIVFVLDYLRDSDIKEFHSDIDHEKEAESEKTYKWVLERNSEHKRRIQMMKRKKNQEITKRHIFRKNVSG